MLCWLNPVLGCYRCVHASAFCSIVHTKVKEKKAFEITKVNIKVSVRTFLYIDIGSMCITKLF